MLDIDYFPRWIVQSPETFVRAFLTSLGVSVNEFGQLTTADNLKPKAIIAKLREAYRLNCEHHGIGWTYGTINDSIAVVVGQLEGEHRPAWSDVFEGFAFAVELEPPGKHFSLVKASDIYKAYKEWCKDHRIEARTSAWLNEQLRYHGIPSKRYNDLGGHVYFMVNKDCSLVSEHEQHEDETIREISSYEYHEKRYRK